MTPTSLGLAVAAVSIVELDVSAAGQFMVSRPMVLGPALGFILGDPVLGTVVGALFELLSLNQPPVGGWLPLNATVATAASLLLTLGLAIPFELAFPAGAVSGWAHRRLEEQLRRRRGPLGARLDQRLGRGAKTGFGRLVVTELAKHASMTFLVLSLTLLLAAAVGRFGMGLPQPVLSGFKFGLGFLPWLALASLIRSFKVVF